MASTNSTTTFKRRRTQSYRRDLLSYVMHHVSPHPINSCDDDVLHHKKKTKNDSVELPIPSTPAERPDLNAGIHLINNLLSVPNQDGRKTTDSPKSLPARANNIKTINNDLSPTNEKFQQPISSIENQQIKTKCENTSNFSTTEDQFLSPSTSKRQFSRISTTKKRSRRRKSSKNAAALHGASRDTSEYQENSNCGFKPMIGVDVKQREKPHTELEIAFADQAKSTETKGSKSDIEPNRRLNNTNGTTTKGTNNSYIDNSEIESEKVQEVKYHKTIPKIASPQRGGDNLTESDADEDEYRVGVVTTLLSRSSHKRNKENNVNVGHRLDTYSAAKNKRYQNENNDMDQDKRNGYSTQQEPSSDSRHDVNESLPRSYTCNINYFVSSSSSGSTNSLHPKTENSDENMKTIESAIQSIAREDVDFKVMSGSENPEDMENTSLENSINVPMKSKTMGVDSSSLPHFNIHFTSADDRGKRINHSVWNNSCENSSSDVEAPSIEMKENNFETKSLYASEKHQKQNGKKKIRKKPKTHLLNSSLADEPIIPSPDDCNSQTRLATVEEVPSMKIKKQISQQPIDLVSNESGGEEKNYPRNEEKSDILSKARKGFTEFGDRTKGIIPKHWQSIAQDDEYEEDDDDGDIPLSQKQRGDSGTKPEPIVHISDSDDSHTGSLEIQCNKEKRKEIQRQNITSVQSEQSGSHVILDSDDDLPEFNFAKNKAKISHGNTLTQTPRSNVRDSTYNTPGKDRKYTQTGANDPNTTANGNSSLEIMSNVNGVLRYRTKLQENNHTEQAISIEPKEDAEDQIEVPVCSPSNSLVGVETNGEFDVNKKSLSPFSPLISPPPLKGFARCRKTKCKKNTHEQSTSQIEKREESNDDSGNILSNETQKIGSTDCPIKSSNLSKKIGKYGPYRQEVGVPADVETLDNICERLQDDPKGITHKKEMNSTGDEEVHLVTAEELNMSAKTELKDAPEIRIRTPGSDSLRETPRRSPRVAAARRRSHGSSALTEVVDLTAIDNDDTNEGPADSAVKNTSLSQTLELLEKFHIDIDVKSPLDLPKCPYLKPLTKDEEELVRQLTIGRGQNYKVSTIHSAKITLRHDDFRRLRGTRWLNDELINAYCALINLRNRSIHTYLCEQERQNIPRTYVFNSFFYTRLTSGKDGYDYRGVERWTTRANVDILQYDLILIPVNLGNHHWVLSAIAIDKKEFYYLDSMHGRDRAKVIECFRKWLIDEVTAKHGKDVAAQYDISNWTTRRNQYLIRRTNVLPKELEPTTNKTQQRLIKIPRQGDGGSCGVFTAKTADCLSLGIKVYFKQPHIQLIRARMAIDLFQRFIPM